MDMGGGGEKAINPDLGFVKDVMASGGESLKKCYQCATCTVVCSVTPDDKPFPRKEMVQAQWGLRDELFSNPDIWLCHQCSDCTANCPRGAKPGEVMAAIRKISLRKYSGGFSKAVNDPKFLLPLVALPVLIFLVLLGLQGNLDLANIPRVDGKIVYSEFMGVFPYIDVTFGLTALFAAIMLIRGMLRYWKDLSVDLTETRKMVSGGIIGTLIPTLMDILMHNRFRKCEVTKARSVTHLMVFYSFMGLVVTTTIAIIYLYLLNRPSPYPLADPMKILGNLSAIGLLAGISLVIVFRLVNENRAGMGGYYDWLFIGVIFVIVATGISSEVLRLADIAVLAYPVYFMHLVSVFFLFAYAPFSKMAHIAYRTTAMLFANVQGRK